MGHPYVGQLPAIEDTTINLYIFHMDAYKCSLFPRVGLIWNKLPDNAISAANFNLFNQYINCIMQ